MTYFIGEENMINAQLGKAFETTTMKILIERVSTSNSAFAVNEAGEAVFLNAEMVDRMALDSGEVLLAQCIPNYGHMRDHTPWRCVRGEQIGDLCH